MVLLGAAHSDAEPSNRLAGQIELLPHGVLSLEMIYYQEF